MRLQLRLLSKDCQVGVAQPPSLITSQLPHAREQCDRVGVLVARVAVGKMTAEVAGTEGAQYRIGERMGGDVGVGMAAQSLIVLDLDAAEHEPPSRFERVKIEAVAYAISRRHCTKPRARTRPPSALFALRPTALTTAISLAKLSLTRTARRVARNARICEEPEIHHRHNRGPVGGLRHLCKFSNRHGHVLPAALQHPETAARALGGDKRRGFFRRGPPRRHSLAVGAALKQFIARH